MYVLLQESTSLPDQLDEAANYIKRLQTNLERMKERKDSLMRVETSTNTTSRSSSGGKSPEIQIHEMGSSLVIGLTTGANGQSIFNETIRILYEEGAEIVNASFSVVDDTAFHTIHLTVGMLCFHFHYPFFSCGVRNSKYSGIFYQNLGFV